MPEEAKEERPQWEAIQAKTFKKWCNMYLKRKNFPILTVDRPINEAFMNGIPLMHLVNALYDIPMPKKYNKTKKCKLRPMKLDNINQAMDMLTKKAEVKTNFLKNVNILDGDWKMMLGMIWAIILDFNSKGLDKEEGKNLKDGLLIWCRKKVAGYKGIKEGHPTNFKGQWKNGKLLAALVHRHYPDKLDYAESTKKGYEQKELVEEAFARLEELGVERLLDVEDLTDVATPDEKSVMTYVSEVYKVLSATDMKEKSAQHIKNFLEFVRNVVMLQTEYETRAKKWCDGCQNQIQEFGEAKEAETSSGAAEALHAYKQYVLGVQPKMIAEKIELEELYTNIQSQLKVNKRAAWACDEAVTPEKLDSVLEDLNTASKTHYHNTRETRFKFVEAMKATEISEDQTKEWNDAFDHFDDNKNDYLEFEEFTAALKAVGVPMTEDAEKAKFNELKASVKMDDNPVKIECVNRAKFLGFLENMYTAKDTPASIIASMDMVGGSEGSSAKLAAEVFNQPPLDDEDREFLDKHCPKNDDGTYNFAAFTKAQFGDN